MVSSEDKRFPFTLLRHTQAMISTSHAIHLIIWRLPFNLMSLILYLSSKEKLQVFSPFRRGSEVNAIDISMQHVKLLNVLKIAASN